jgi:hypothetical protein
MSSGSTVPDPDPELINAQNFDFAKPKLFFKNIGKYAATSTYIHVRIPFNFTTVFNTKQAIAGVYDQLLDKHEEPFKSSAKSDRTSAWPSPKGHEKISGTSLKHCLTKRRSQRQAGLNDSSPLVISITPMAKSTFENKKTSQKKGGDKVNNKEKRKDTKVKKVYQ